MNESKAAARFRKAVDWREKQQVTARAKVMIKPGLGRYERQENDA